MSNVPTIVVPINANIKILKDDFLIENYNLYCESFQHQFYNFNNIFKIESLVVANGKLINCIYSNNKNFHIKYDEKGNMVNYVILPSKYSQISEDLNYDIDKGIIYLPPKIIIIDDLYNKDVYDIKIEFKLYIYQKDLFKIFMLRNQPKYESSENKIKDCIEFIKDLYKIVKSEGENV